jgi:hypothetical protein
MTMHLAHPSLSTTGKKKGKRKFASAEAKRRAEALDASWAELKKSHGVSEEDKRRKRAMAAPPLNSVYSLKPPPGRETTQHIKSLGQDNGVATMSAPKVYTGTKVKGIATMHKSNAVPVFSDEEAVEISRMRRG